MATNGKEEIKIEAPKETMEMAATPAPVPAVQAPVTRDEAYANAVEASKRTGANGVTTPAPVSAPSPVSQAPAVQPPTDYKYNPETGKYDAQAQTPAPVTPAPKAETQKPVKAETPIDYNASTGREAEIQKNLSDITATNPALTQDRAKFDAAFGYQTADVGKKALLDSFFDSKRVKSQDDFLGILNAGRTVSEDLKGSPEYKMAKSRFDAVQNYKSFTVPQFSSALASGSLIPGSQAYKDLMNNPESASNIRKAQALNAINKKPVSEEGKREAVMGEIKATTFGQAVADGFIDPQEADALMTTPEITAKQKEIEPLKNKYDALKADYDNIETDTKNEFQASGKSRDYINAKISERRKNAYRDLSVLESRYNNAVGALADMKKAQAEVLSFNKDLWSAERGFEKQKELAQFQSDISVSSEVKKFEQKMQQQAAVAKDPTLATQAVLDQYREMGVLAQRSDAEILADVQSQVASGKPLGQVLTDLNKAFQSKPEYQAVRDRMFPKPVVEDAPKPSWKQDDAGNWYDASSAVSPEAQISGTATGDLTWMADKFPGQAWAKNNNPAGIKTTISARTRKLLEDAGVSWEEGTKPPKGEGGTYMKFATIEDGLKAYKVLLTQAGTKDVYARLKQWVGTSEGDRYATQLMKEAGIDTNQSVSFDSLTDEQTQKLLMAQIRKESPGLYGVLTKPSAKPQDSKISASVDSYVDMYNKGSMSLEDIFTKIGSSKEGLALKNAISQKVSEQGGRQVRGENDPLVASLKSQLDDLKFLRDDEYMDSVVGPNALARTSFGNFITGGKDNYLATARQVLSSNVLQSLIDAKAKGATFGALSDSELNLLKASANKLASRAIYDGDEIVGFRGNEKDFKAELDKLVANTERAIRLATGNTQSSAPVTNSSKKYE